LLTRRNNGTLVLAIWNYAPPGENGLAKTITLRFENTKRQVATISRLDHEHGDFHSVYGKMSTPGYPTLSQILELRRASELPEPETIELKADKLTLPLPAQGLVLIELK
jgi:xylan 1,4-beta-xylosidase